MVFKVIKILEIDSKIKCGDSLFGYTYLHKEGTIRYVKKLTFRCIKIVKQIATIEFSSDMGEVIHYNKWKDYE